MLNPCNEKGLKEDFPASEKLSYGITKRRAPKSPFTITCAADSTETNCLCDVILWCSTYPPTITDHINYKIWCVWLVYVGCLTLQSNYIDLPYSWYICIIMVCTFWDFKIKFSNLQNRYDDETLSQYVSRYSTSFAHNTLLS